MPRPIITNPNRNVSPDLKADPASKPRPSNCVPESIRVRTRRSGAYLERMTKLDAGTHLESRQAFEELCAAVQAELGELSLSEFPLGLLARCYLGAPFQVHVLDLAGSIIRHVKSGEAMAPPFERARALALHPAYAFIEVFPSSMQCVRPDGAVSSA